MENEILKYFKTLAPIVNDIITINTPPEYPNYVFEMHNNTISYKHYVDIKDAEFHVKDLLESNDIEKVILGYLSVILWGNVGNSKDKNEKIQFAIKRAEKSGFIKTLNSKITYQIDKKEEMEQLFYKIKYIREIVSEGKYSVAIDFARTIPRLGFSFASKLIMFLDPQNCGVLDKIIGKKLNSNLIDLDIKTGTVLSTEKNFILYSKYCNWLIDSKTKIKDKNGILLFNKASDLERYLFSPKP